MGLVQRQPPFFRRLYQGQDLLEVDDLVEGRRGIAKAPGVPDPEVDGASRVALAGHLDELRQEVEAVKIGEALVLEL